MSQANAQIEETARYGPVAWNDSAVPRVMAALAQDDGIVAQANSLCRCRAPTIHSTTLNDAPIRARPDITTRIVDDEAVLYDHARDTMHYLNATAAFVWGYCERGCTEPGILRAAVEAFGGGAASDDTIARAVRDAIAMLRRDGLLCGAAP